MKKFLAIAAIAGVLVACNNNSKSDKTDNDTIKPAGTTTIITQKDTVTVPSNDTIKATADTTKNKK
ncbi:MAG: hypothetical protein C4308_08960 [Chitinophagaceae bacterium]